MPDLTTRVEPFQTVYDVPVPLMDTRCGACGHSYGQHYGNTGIICPDTYLGRAISDGLRCARAPASRVTTFVVSVFRDDHALPRPPDEYDELVRLFQPLVDRAQEAREEARSIQFAGLAEEEVASEVESCACGDGCESGSCDSCGDFDEPERDEPYDDSFVSDSCTCVDCIAASQYVGEVS